MNLRVFYYKEGFVHGMLFGLSAVATIIIFLAAFLDRSLAGIAAGWVFLIMSVIMLRDRKKRIKELEQ